MRKLLYLLFLLTIIRAAHACPEQFVCDQSGCNRVPVLSCSALSSSIVQPSHSTSNSVVYGPTHSGLFSSQPSQVHAPASIPAALSPVQSQYQSQAQAQLFQSYAPLCAENGSCYGDISSINGMPKTTHVNGYFRKDGTYVRGHYRSSGRR